MNDLTPRLPHALVSLCGLGNVLGSHGGDALAVATPTSSSSAHKRSAAMSETIASFKCVLSMVLLAGALALSAKMVAA
jgi:hypothetical protein